MHVKQTVIHIQSACVHQNSGMITRYSKIFVKISKLVFIICIFCKIIYWFEYNDNVPVRIIDNNNQGMTKEIEGEDYIMDRLVIQIKFSGGCKHWIHRNQSRNCISILGRFCCYI